MDKNFKETIYKEDLKTIWNDKMVQWELKEFSNAVQFEDGKYLVFNKPSIETHFCFGYGYCGVSTEEDYQGAASAEKHARTNEEYFIDENLKNLNILKNTFLDSSNIIEIAPKYYRQGENCNLVSYRVRSAWDTCKESTIRELTAVERIAVVQVIDEEIAKFTKRLNSYLKRYGLSKLHTWTYLVD